MPSPPPYSADWNTSSGNWFAAGNWTEIDPVTNAIVHYVPGADNAVTLSYTAPFTVDYNGVDEIWSLSGTNATLNINGGSLAVDHDSFLGGVINLASGASLSAAAGATLTFFGGSIAGTLGGAGTIQFQYGDFDLNAGTALSVANLILGVYGNGTVSRTTLGANLTYAGRFTQIDYSGNQALLLLNGHTLKLTGGATLDGTISGPGRVIVYGRVDEPTGYGGNSIVGGATLEAASGATITQNGSVFLGDASSKGTLRIDSGATYSIATIGTINSGGNSLLINNGRLVDKAVGATASWINGGFTNNGRLTVATGATLNFAFPGAGVETFGGTIDGGGTLSFSNGVKALVTSTAVTVGHWTITDGTTELGVDLTYGGAFKFEAAFGVLDLAGHTLTLTGASNSLAAPYGNIKGGGRLKIAGAVTFGDLAVGYDDVATTIEVAGSAKQTAGISLHGTLQIDSGASYRIAGGSISSSGASGATTINRGTILDVAPGTSRILGAFTNAGVLTIAAGATLEFSGVEKFGGSIGGNGALSIGFGAQARIDTADVTVARLIINGGNGGGTTTLGVHLSYAGNFTFASQFGTLDLNGHKLTLSGVSSLSGTIGGSGRVKVTGSSTIAGLTIDQGSGAATLEDAGSITQTDPLTLDGALLIDAGASYKIVSAPYGGGINNGGSATITNNGTFAVQTSGAATIQGSFTNTGALTIAAGATANFSGVETFGGSISGAGTLAFGFGARATINTTNVTVANLYINGGNGGGVAKLGVHLSYAGNFTFASQFGTLDLNGRKLTLSGVSILSGGNVAGPGRLYITGSSTIGALSLGNGAAVPTLEVAGMVEQNNFLALSGALVIDAAGVWKIVADTGITLSGAGSIANSGLLEKTAGTGLGDIWLNGLAFANAGTVLAKSGALRIHGSLANSGLAKADGATLIIDGALTGSGSAAIDHQGTLQIGGAVAAGEEIKFLSAAGETLDLLTPSSFAGQLDGFGDGDLLRLHGVAATAASISGSKLHVTAAGGVAYDFTLANVQAGYFTIDVHDGESDVRLTTGGDELTGAETDDTMFGGSGIDILNGAGGNDWLRGGGGKDVLDGGAGVDTADYSDKTASVVVTLNGATNAVVKVGGVTEDTIRNMENIAGGSGADRLTGDNSANSLWGGGGGDMLKGGGGADTFVFTPSFGKDTVADFAAIDRLQIDHTLFADWTSLLSHTAQVGTSTVITLDAANTITLQNFVAADLTQSQVNFV
ncbi:S-layer family protein [Methylosinus sp. Sm6]|uniref:beta strand repeat-containing protein n=1 Tax=Methylosinus sp. Sm6 TaxID=2866948 RepID=UPI001C98FB19|nr:hypothetical protein [Methylosinus sp. Sm6]MBY6241112.1 hypothetical protein [Methylosinus sp. Sm6]